MNKGLSIPFVLVVSLLMFASLGWPHLICPLSLMKKPALKKFTIMKSGWSFSYIH